MWLKEYYEVLGAATKKAQAYTDQEVSKVRTKFAVVASYADLPNPGRTDTIYLVPKAGFVSVYDQYIYENDQYTDIGDTELDLDSYATDLELSQGLATKVDKVEGKGLSTNDYTNEDQAKVQQFEVDSELDKTSTNAIQNKVVTEKFEEVEAEIFNEDKVAEGNPITIETGSIGTANSTELTMSPIQDLHGYGKPWVGGAGKNKWSIGDLTINTATGLALSLPAGTYTFSANRTRNAVNLSMRFNYVDTTSIVVLFNTFTGQTFTLGQECVSINFAFTSFQEGDKITNIQIESGSTATSYEPYSNICPISGRTQSEIWGCAKNLAKPIRTVSETWSSKGVDYVCNSDYSISMSGTYTGTAFGQQQATSVILPPGTYIFNGQNGVDSTNKKATLQLYDAETQTQLINRDTAADYEFTLTKPTEIWINIGMRVGFASVSQITMSPMIRRVGEDATYEPYVQGDSVTRNYGQTVYGGSDNVETGELAVEYMCKEFDGTESITPIGTGANRFYRYISEDVELSIIQQNIYGCSHFENAQVTTSTTYFGCYAYFSEAQQQSYIQFRPNISGVTDTDTFKAWLAAQYANGTPVQVFSKLRTPQTITLTPAQVNLIKGINNISTDADSIKMTYTINDFVTETEMNTALESKANVIDLNGKADLTSFGPLEVITASTNYAEGDYMIFEGKFCKASAAITAGDTLEIGTNLTETTIAAELLAIISQLPTT